MASEKPLRLTVIIPVYNEVGTVSAMIDRIAKLNISNEREIIVVDDGSTDGTRELLEDFSLPCGTSDHSILKTIFREQNRGKGAAIQTGLTHANGEIITIQDADLEYHPEDYPVAIKLIQDGHADAVYGSRFLGPHRCFLFWHYGANKFLTMLTNIMFNTILTDMETGFKVFRAEVLKSLGIRSYTFDFEVEVTAKLCKRRYRLYEIPITYTGRSFEEGKKIRWQDGVRALWALLKFRLMD